MWKTSLKSELTPEHLNFCTSPMFKKIIIDEQNLDFLFKIPHTRYLYYPINHDLFNYIGTNKNFKGDLAVTNTSDYDGLELGKVSSSRELTKKEIKELGLPNIDNIDSYFNFKFEGEQVEFIIPNEIDKDGRFIIKGNVDVPREKIIESDYGYILGLLSEGRCGFDIQSFGRKL